MKSVAKEYNFDGLVGPTHNYAGLSDGNIASITHGNLVSNPKAAALQGLEKMKKLYDLGVPQAVLPPQLRPNLTFLKHLGFSGSVEKILKQAYQTAPKLFTASYSASAMWAANAATITPSCDSQDNKVHFTPANLASNIHRAIEADATFSVLKQIFKDTNLFTVHAPIISHNALGDEGAANYTRFCNGYGDQGVALFVYGQEYYNKDSVKPRKYPARQTLEASQAVARQHMLSFDKVLFLQQLPESIDHGVFHNDVCSVGNKNLFLCYENSFVNQKNSLAKLREICIDQHIDLQIHEAAQKDLSYTDMVNSYLFNSQLVSVNNKSLLIAPIECQENQAASNVLRNIMSDKFIDDVIYVDCRQSMFNGGGPACLRLRVVLTDEEAEAINKSSNVLFNESLYQALKACINNYYRDKLGLKDLLDPEFVAESTRIQVKLAEILKLDLG